MNPESSFRILAPQVVHQAIEGEVVAIQMETGAYYSLTGAAAEVWLCLHSGLPLAGVAQHLQTVFTDPPPDLPCMVERLVQSFLAEQLVAETGAFTHGPLPGAVPAKRPFAEPGFEKFTDMQELLLLDPIHEVGEAGWPNPKGHE